MHNYSVASRLPFKAILRIYLVPKFRRVRPANGYDGWLLRVPFGLFAIFIAYRYPSWLTYGATFQTSIMIAIWPTPASKEGGKMYRWTWEYVLQLYV